MNEISLENLINLYDEEIPLDIPKEEPTESIEPIEQEDVATPEKSDIIPQLEPLEEYYNLLKENELLYTDEDFRFEGTSESLEKAIIQTKQNLRDGIAKTL